MKKKSENATQARLSRALDEDQIRPAHRDLFKLSPRCLPASK